MITTKIDEETIENFLKTVRQIVKEEIIAAKQIELQEKLYSPSEACKIFIPKISRVTLAAWTKEGYLKRYDLGGRVFYKWSELMDAAKTLKRYKKVQLDSTGKLEEIEKPRQKKGVMELSNGYVTQVFKKEGFPVNAINKDLINIKSLMIKTKREIKKQTI